MIGSKSTPTTDVDGNPLPPNQLMTPHGTPKHLAQPGHRPKRTPASRIRDALSMYLNAFDGNRLQLRALRAREAAKDPAGAMVLRQLRIAILSSSEKNSTAAFIALCKAAGVYTDAPQIAIVNEGIALLPQTDAEHACVQVADVVNTSARIHILAAEDGNGALDPDVQPTNGHES